MASLADLNRAVQATLASKRLGTPVFVRLHLTNRDRAAAVPRRLAQLASLAGGWIGRPLERAYALGGAKAGHAALMLEYQGGATGVVGWAAGEPRGGGVDLMLIGNHGAVYHDAGTARLWDEPAAPPDAAPPADLLELVERALRTGRPEAAGGEGRP
jgi:hypothetical protein